MRKVFCFLVVLRLLSAADVEYSQWGSWGDCSVPCGIGKQMRPRICKNPVSQHDIQGCTRLGPAYELRTCQAVCPPVNGGYSKWGLWSECSAICGGGKRSRLRSCTNPTPEKGGKSCSKVGPSLQVSRCNENLCT